MDYVNSSTFRTFLSRTQWAGDCGADVDRDSLLGQVHRKPGSVVSRRRSLLFAVAIGAVVLAVAAPVRAAFIDESSPRLPSDVADSYVVVAADVDDSGAPDLLIGNGGGVQLP